MPASEIDDIFASKGQGVPATPTPSSSVPPKKKKKDRGAKRKREPEPEDDAPSKPPAKRPAPETVLDPSVRPAAAAPRPPKALAAASKKRPKAGREDEERFKDSRGAGSSMSLTAQHVDLPRNATAIRTNHGRRLGCLQRGRTRHHRSGWRYSSMSVRLPMLFLDDMYQYVPPMRYPWFPLETLLLYHGSFEASSTASLRWARSMCSQYFLSLVDVLSDLLIRRGQYTFSNLGAHANKVDPTVRQSSLFVKYFLMSLISKSHIVITSACAKHSFLSTHVQVYIVSPQYNCGRRFKLPVSLTCTFANCPFPNSTISRS